MTSAELTGNIRNTVSQWKDKGYVLMNVLVLCCREGSDWIDTKLVSEIIFKQNVGVTQMQGWLSSLCVIAPKSAF